MSSVFEEEEELEVREREHDEHEGDDRRDREVTLNSMTLLGIFFALVLICGLCFGAGFAMGRRGAPESAGDGAAPGKIDKASAAEKTGVVPEPVEFHAKPSPSAQGSAVTPTVSHDTSAPEPLASSAKDQPAEDVESAKVQDVPAREPQVPKNSAKPTVAPGLANAPGTYMVQIAAVSNPADAEVLLGALTKRGYTVVIRHETTDALLHVQIGPLPSRAEAGTMKQKLQSDGYNAILK